MKMVPNIPGFIPLGFYFGSDKSKKMQGKVARDQPRDFLETKSEASLRQIKAMRSGKTDRDRVLLIVLSTR